MALGKEIDDFVKTFMAGWKMIQREREIELRDARSRRPRPKSEAQLAREAEAEAVRKAGDEGEAAAGGTPSRASSDTPLGNSTDIETRFMKTVREEGLTNPYALAAVAGTGSAESSWKSSALNDSWNDPSESGKPGRSGGAMSWREDRLRNMLGFAAKNGEGKGSITPETQARFFVKEDPALVARLQGAKSVGEAADMMAKAWRFKGYDDPSSFEYNRRLGLSEKYLPRYGGAGATRTAGIPDGSSVAGVPEQNTDYASYDEPLVTDEDDEVAAFATGGAVKEGWSTSGPTANGSVYTQYTRPAPKPTPAQPQASAPQTAIPTDAAPAPMSSGDRFRQLRADREAKLAAAANAPKPSYYDFSDDFAFKNKVWATNLENDRSPKPAPSQAWGQSAAMGTPYGDPRKMPAGTNKANASDHELAEFYGGLRTDPSGTYVIRPPRYDASAAEQESYRALPKATSAQNPMGDYDWRMATYHANAERYAPQGGFANMTGYAENGGMIRHYEDGGAVADEDPPVMPVETPAPRSAIPETPHMQDSTTADRAGSGASWRSEMAGYDPNVLVNREGAADAVKAGLGWLQKSFGFSTDSAAIPEASPDRRKNVEAWARNEGAPTTAEVKKIDQTIDPENKLRPEVKSLARMYGVYKLYESRGDTEKAARMAGAMAMHSKRVLATGGVIVEDLLKQGRVGDAAKVAEKAYNEIPDGKSIKVQPGKNGVEYKLFDENGELTDQGKLGMNELLRMSTGMKDGTLWLSSMGMLASPGARRSAAARPAAPERLTKDERAARDARLGEEKVATDRKTQVTEKMAEIDEQAAKTPVPPRGPADAVDRQANARREEVTGAANREAAFQRLDKSWAAASKGVAKSSVASRANTDDSAFVKGMGPIAEKMPTNVRGSLVGVARDLLRGNDISAEEAGRVVSEMAAKGWAMSSDGTVRPKGSQERGIYIDSRSLRAIMEIRGEKVTSLGNVKGLGATQADTRKLVSEGEKDQARAAAVVPDAPRSPSAKEKAAEIMARRTPGAQPPAPATERRSTTGNMARLLRQQRLEEQAKNQTAIPVN